MALLCGASLGGLELGIRPSRRYVSAGGHGWCELCAGHSAHWGAPPGNYEAVVLGNCVEVVLGSRAWTLQEEDSDREKEGAAFGAAFLRVDMSSECKRGQWVWSRKVAAVSPCSQHAVSC